MIVLTVNETVLFQSSSINYDRGIKCSQSFFQNILVYGAIGGIPVHVDMNSQVCEIEIIDESESFPNGAFGTFTIRYDAVDLVGISQSHPGCNGKTTA
jgi:hypothetical protein